MIIVSYRPLSLFQRYVAAYGDLVAYGPSRKAAIARVLGQLAAQHALTDGADDIDDI